LPGHPGADLPANPAGERLAEFLAGFNGGDRAAISRFIAQHYAPSALQDQTVDERATWDLSLQRDTGGLNIAYVEPGSDAEILAYAQAALTGDWFRIRLSVSPEPPHAITAITTRPSQRPALLGPHPALGSDELIVRLKEMLGRLIRADMFSGALLMARDGQPIFRLAFGFANQAYGVPNQLDTKFNVGSLSKSITAVAIGQLAGQGLLAFDDPLIKHLPDIPSQIGERVTIHHLLTHTSGLGNYWNEKFEASRARLRTVADFIPLFIDDPPAFEPGSRWSYSNAGYILLGAIIEAVSRQTYYDYVREHIYQPAGMIHTDAYEMDRPVPNLAIGYTYNGLDDRPEFGPRRTNLFMHVVKGGPAGGAFSTVDDLFSFSQALLGHKLLSPEMTGLVLEGKVSMGKAEEKQYAYGFMLTLVDGKRVVGHSGAFPGIGARLDMYLDHGYTVVILSNYDPYITQAIGNKLHEWIAGY
jgi:CubicO group peptidase (beta-lactamase class C family)